MNAIYTAIRARDAKAARKAAQFHVEKAKEAAKRAMLD